MDAMMRKCRRGQTSMSLFHLQNVSLFVLQFVLVAETSIYKEPGFYEKPICNRKDPHLTACIRNQMENVRGRLKNGMPQMDVPPLDPLEIPLINLTQDEDKFLFKFFNVHVTGFSSFVMEDIKIDVNQMNMSIKCHAPRISFQGQYKIRGPVFRVKLNSTGNVNLTFWQVPFEVYMEGELYEKKDRQVYLEIVQLNNTLEVPKRAHINFDNIFNGDLQRESIIQKLVNDNWRSIFEMYKSVPEVGLTELFKNITNRVFSTTPYNMILG